MHYLLLLAAMQYLHLGIKAGDGPRYGVQPLLIDRHNGFSETWRIENGSSGDCKCYEFFISNSWPALTQRILDFFGANALCWNALKKLDLSVLQWLPPLSSLAFARQSFLSLCATLAPCLIPPAGFLTSPCWHSAGSGRERGGVSECIGAGGGCSEAWILLPCHLDCFYSWQARVTFGCLFSFLLAPSPWVRVKSASLTVF